MDSGRAIRVALGCLWLFDGLLKFQPDLWHSGFVGTVVAPNTVVIRIHFTDFTGKVMFHCHIAAHEDAGMMSFVNVVTPPAP